MVLSATIERRYFSYLSWSFSELLSSNVEDTGPDTNQFVINPC